MIYYRINNRFYATLTEARREIKTHTGYIDGIFKCEIDTSKESILRMLNYEGRYYKADEIKVSNLGE